MSVLQGVASRSLTCACNSAGAVRARGAVRWRERRMNYDRRVGSERREQNRKSDKEAYTKTSGQTQMKASDRLQGEEGECGERGVLRERRRKAVREGRRKRPHMKTRRGGWGRGEADRASVRQPNQTNKGTRFPRMRESAEPKADRVKTRERQNNGQRKQTNPSRKRNQGTDRQTVRSESQRAATKGGRGVEGKGDWGERAERVSEREREMWTVRGCRTEHAQGRQTGAAGTGRRQGVVEWGWSDWHEQRVHLVLQERVAEETRRRDALSLRRRARTDQIPCDRIDARRGNHSRLAAGRQRRRARNGRGQAHSLIAFRRCGLSDGVHCRFGVRFQLCSVPAAARAHLVHDHTEAVHV